MIKYNRKGSTRRVTIKYLDCFIVLLNNTKKQKRRIKKELMLNRVKK